MKSFLLVICLLCSFAPSLAQKAIIDYRRHEVFVSYGFSPVLLSLESLLPSSTPIGPNTEYTAINVEKSGFFVAGYSFHISRPLAIGLQYTYNTAEGDFVIGSSIPLGHLNCSYHTILLTGKYEWLQLRCFTLYSRAGVGFTTIKAGEMEGEPSSFIPSYVENQKSFAWQVMPVGVEWRFAGPLALFAEGGIGVTGCGMAGVKVRF